MKKLLVLIATLLAVAVMFSSCSMLDRLLGNQGGGDIGGENSGNTENPGDVEEKPDDGGNTEKPDDGGNTEKPDDGGNTEKPDDGGNTEKPDDGDNTEKPDDGGNTEKPDDGGNKYTYTAFTAEERALFMEVAGAVVPFVPTNEYYVEEYYDEYYEENCISYYTFGNTKADFDAYYDLFVGYELVDSFEDSYGDTWYCLNGATYVEMSFYYYDGDYVIDVYVYTPIEDGSGDNSGNEGGSDNGSTDNDNDSGDYLYNDFTSAEKSLFKEYFGEVIPFLINNEYYVEEYNFDYSDGEYEEGINFYVYGATQMQFGLYRALFSDYSYDGSETDEYGDAWYYYTADAGYYVDMSYYSDGERYVVDVYVYHLYEGSGSGNGGNGGNGGTTTTPDGLITNEGAGLPSGTNGVYDVDFTDGKYVKDVTDQGYYLDGCPTTGSPAVLVIPIDFSDINGRNNGYYNIDNIVRAFSGESGSCDYYSVKEYYYISSYGKLDLDITVINEWFVPKNTSTYYKNATYDYYGDQVAIGDQLILDEALAYLSGKMDLSKFDSDGNGIIDAVVLINTLDVDSDSDFNWAYRYWNIYTDDEGYYYEYDGVSANDYLWASYSFMHESYNAYDEAIYTDTSVMNTYTYIHEFGHILGSDDYYDTSYVGNHPLDSCDIMDGMNGDHNPFTKFNYGWLTTSRLVTTSTSVTLTLNSFTKTGDTIIIANNFDPTLGAYQEYYIVVYYTMDGLNGGDYGYFMREGIIVYHVNASLYSENYEGEIYYDIYNNNTDPSDEYGTEDNLIELVKSTEGNYTYVAGDSIPAVTDDQGNKLAYSFTVDSLNGDSATITFTKR